MLWITCSSTAIIAGSSSIRSPCSVIFEWGMGPTPPWPIWRSVDRV